MATTQLKNLIKFKNVLNDNFLRLEKTDNNYSIFKEQNKIISFSVFENEDIIKKFIEKVNTITLEVDSNEQEIEKSLILKKIIMDLNC